MRSIFQAFIDSMTRSNNTLTYKDLIHGVRYVRLVVSPTRTYAIVISEYMKRNKFPQKPQVSRLSGIAPPICFLTYFSFIAIKFS
jgi:hypothetical protein